MVKHKFNPSRYTASSIQELAEKYPLTITAAQKDDVAEIRIMGALYEWNNSVEKFTAQVDDLIAQGHQDVDVYINTPGGDVFVAAEIINQLQRFSGAKTGRSGALVASAGTVIAISLDSFEMASNAQFMYHKPSGWISGNENTIESQLTLLKNLTAQYKKMYADKTGMSEETIENNWSKGDVWLTAAQALEQKFVTSVKGTAKITKPTAEMITACGGVAPKITEEIKPLNMKNRNQIIALLKLSADATDEQIEAAVKLHTEKSAQVEAMQSIADANTNKEINALVDGAIAAKKITADVKEHYVALAKKDLAGTKAIIESLQVVEKPTLDPTAEAGKEKWTMEDWQQKDPNGLIQMMSENPDAFAKLEKEYFNN